MHELSIALSIIEIAEEESAHLSAPVRAIHLKLGVMSGVVKEALIFSYEVACEQTPLEGSKLLVQEVPIVVDCLCCGGKRSVYSIQDLRCVACGTPATEVVEGREIEVVALELEQ